MILLEDSRQKVGKHDLKHAWFKKNGVEVVRSKLVVGDYTLPTDQSICIDTKQNIAELASDVTQQHVRFREECIRAQKLGIKLIILVENKTEKITKDIYNPAITKLEELYKWKNPQAFIFANGKRKYPKARRGIEIMKACMTMEKRYGVKFLFCSPYESADMIVRLLSREKI